MPQSVTGSWSTAGVPTWAQPQVAKVSRLKAQQLSLPPLPPQTTTLRTQAPTNTPALLAPISHSYCLVQIGLSYSVRLRTGVGEAGCNRHSDLPCFLILNSAIKGGLVEGVLQCRFCSFPPFETVHWNATEPQVCFVLKLLFYNFTLQSVRGREGGSNVGTSAIF